MTTTTSSRRTAVQTVAALIGIVFLLVGVVGFIPGVTANMGSMMFARHASHAMLLGVFEVSILHNIVHLLFGVAGLVFSRSAPAARHYLIWGGAIYLVLFIYGLLINSASPANFVPLNAADNALHAVLGIAMLILGLILRPNPARQ